jgi:hypothetical protein
MQYAELKKDPRYQRVPYFMEMWDLGWGLPSDPHAKENLKYAAGKLACDPGPDAEQFLALALKTYIGEKYRDAVEKDIRRVAQAAAREPATDG